MVETTSAPLPVGPEEPRTRVFLSYSREDKEFTHFLAQALDARGYTPVFDTSESLLEDPDLVLTAQDEWWTQLKRMIAAADIMVFVISPASASSRVCDDEIAFAKSVGKRVIPILRREIDVNAAPERLRALNWKLNFVSDDSGEIGSSLADLCVELERDMEWHRRGSHFARLARQWDSEARPDGQLLRAGAITDAETWLINRPTNGPEPGALLLEFLEKSRLKETRDQNQLRRAVGLSYVGPIRAADQAGNHALGLKLLAAGTLLVDDPTFALAPELYEAGTHLIARCRLHATVRARERLEKTCFNQDGSRLLTVDRDGISLWNTADGSEVARLITNERDTGACFSDDGTLVGCARSKVAELFDAKDGRPMSTISRAYYSPSPVVAFSKDGRRLIIASSNTMGIESVDVATGKCVALVRRRYNWQSRHRSPFPERAAKRLEFLVLSPDEGIAVSARELKRKKRRELDDLILEAWRIDTGQAAWRLEEPSNRCHYGAGQETVGAFVVVSSYQGTMVICTRTGNEIARIGVENVRGGMTSNDGRSVVLRVHGQHGLGKPHALVYDVRQLEAPRRLGGHAGELEVAKFSPDGRLVLTADDDGVVVLWETRTGARVADLGRHEARVVDANFSPDGRWVATASDDRTACIWNVEAPATATSNLLHSLTEALRAGNGIVDAADRENVLLQEAPENLLQALGERWPALSVLSSA